MMSTPKLPHSTSADRSTKSSLYCYIRASSSRCSAAVYSKAALCALLIVIRVS